MNFQESTTILNACTKKSGHLLKAPRILAQWKRQKNDITRANYGCHGKISGNVNHYGSLKCQNKINVQNSK